MEKDKYYTPSIEEFHVGFEFEALNSRDWFFSEGSFGWKKAVLSEYLLMRDYTTQNLMFAIKNEWVRVKYLDASDIESFGFKECDLKGFFHHVNDRFYISIDYWLDESDYSFMRLQIGDNESEFSFAGVCKNKSELSKLLKQLSII